MSAIKASIPDGYVLVRDPTATDMVASNVTASLSYLNSAVVKRRAGGELTEQATANLKIIRRWAEMLLSGDVPQPGDGVSDG